MDSVISWFVLTILAWYGIIRFFIYAEVNKNKYKEENEEFFRTLNR